MTQKWGGAPLRSSREVRWKIGWKMSEKSVKNDDFWPQKIPPNCAFDPDRGRYLPWNRPWYLALGPVFLRRIWNQGANASRADDQVRAICKKKSEKIAKTNIKQPIFIWPKSFKEKDVNEFALNTKNRFIETEFLTSRIFNGVRALLELKRMWTTAPLKMSQLRGSQHDVLPALEFPASRRY